MIIDKLSTWNPVHSGFVSALQGFKYIIPTDLHAFQGHCSAVNMIGNWSNFNIFLFSGTSSDDNL